MTQQAFLNLLSKNLRDLPKGGADSGAVATFLKALKGAHSTDDLITDPSGGGAAAGKLGELISAQVASGSAITLTNNTAANVTSISLTAGEWDVAVNGIFLPAATTQIDFLQTEATTTSAGGFTGVQTAAFSLGNLTVVNTGRSIALTPVRKQFLFASTTTVYLVVYALFTVSTMKAHGYISARRVR